MPAPTLNKTPVTHIHTPFFFLQYCGSYVNMHETGFGLFWLCMCFASDSTTVSPYTILFIDHKHYERLILGHSDTTMKVKKTKIMKKNMIKEAKGKMDRQLVQNLQGE